MISFLFKVIEICLFEVIDQRSCETDEINFSPAVIKFAFWKRFRLISMMIFMGWNHHQNRILVTTSQMLYCRIRFPVVESNFVKQIQIPCRRIKVHTPFVSFRRTGCCSGDFYLYQPTLVTVNLNFSFFLSFFLVFPFLNFAAFTNVHFCRDLSFYKMKEV